MEKTLNRQQAQAILDTRPDGVDIPTALKELSNQGFTIEGYNDHPVQNAISNVSSVAKSVVGGIGEGVGGIALTGIEKAGEALTGKKVDLHGQWQQQFGKSENPTAYGIGELGGQVASLTAPVGALGNVAKGASEMVGLGKNVSTLTKAATEGLAFTKGMELQSGQKASPSDYYVNTALNVAFPVAGIVGKGLAENIAPRIVNSLIKPLAKDFAYEKNPGKAVAELGITGNSWEDLIKNITSSKDQIGQSIGQVISKSQNLQQMDLSQTLKSIDEAISNAYKTPRTNATLIGRLESVKQDLVDNIQNGIDPQSFKGLVGDLTKWTGNVSDDQAVNKALKQVYGATRSGMDNILSKEMTPEEFSAYKKASEQYGNLLSAENAAKYRDKVVERQDLISFGAKNAGLITALGTAMATGGSAVPSIIAGLGASAIDKAMATPAFKTRLASLLSKMSPSEVGTLFDKVPTAKTLFTPQQIQDFTGELKKNSKLNRGMVNPSELLPKKKVVSSLEQEAKKYKSAEEFVKAQQPTKVKVVSATQKSDYMGGHEAPMGDSGAPIWDLNGKYTDHQIYPADFYTHGNYYAAGETYDATAISIMQSLKDKPNASVTVYRAVPKSVKNPKLNAGDWVSITREYAKDHGESNLVGDYKIISANVKARDIFTDGNSIHEFGYDPQPQVRPQEMPYEILNRTADKPNTVTGSYKSQLTDIWNKAHGK